MSMPSEGAASAYRPYGAALELFYCRDREVLLDGPAGTGKSRAALEKLHLCALKYAGMRGLIARKTRESLTHSALVTFEEKVLPAGASMHRSIQRRMRTIYRYPNGSEVVVLGLDKPEKVMSAEYDLIYVQEATELSLEEWERLLTRLRNGVMPYQQLLGDCNPGAPTHWLNQRCESGATTRLRSRHEDNPTVTPAYLATLDALTGARKLRLRHGKWVASEGAVYGEEWDPAVHLVDRLPKGSKEWPRFWSVDFGFTNPFVWQEWAQDGDGRLWMAREIYRTGTLVEDLAREILAVTKGEPAPKAVICDHDAEDRATLERHLGLKTVRAWKGISDGIQAVKSRLRRAGDGRPRLFFLRDACRRRDPVLSESHRPACTVEEFDGYVWGERRVAGQVVSQEEPADRDNHGMDACRYAIAHVDEVGRRKVRVY
jgi:phage terminase large subunit